MHVCVLWLNLLVGRGLRAHPGTLLLLFSSLCIIIIFIIIEVILLNVLAAAEVFQDAIGGAPGIIDTVRVYLDRGIQGATGLGRWMEREVNVSDAVFLTKLH